MDLDDVMAKIQKAHQGDKTARDQLVMDNMGWSGVSCGGLKDGAMNWKICFRSAVSAC